MSLRRRIARARRRQRSAIDMKRPFVLIGEQETAVNIPGTGAVFLSTVEDVLVVEAVAFSGPNVEHRKAELERICRGAGFADAIDEARRRGRVAA